MGKGEIKVFQKKRFNTIRTHNEYIGANYQYAYEDKKDTIGYVKQVTFADVKKRKYLIQTYNQNGELVKTIWSRKKYRPFISLFRSLSWF